MEELACLPDTETPCLLIQLTKLLRNYTFAHVRVCNGFRGYDAGFIRSLIRIAELYDKCGYHSLVFFSEIFNAEVLFRDDCTADEFIDVISANRIHLPCLYVSI